MADDGEQMLINLNSPENINNTPYQKTYLKNPLIPGPDVNCNIESNNPFDLVANSAENWDPFELVLHESLKKVENAQNKIYNGISKTDKSNKEFKGHITSQANVNNEQNSVTKPCKIFRSQSVTENIKFFRSPTKNSHRSDSDSPTHSLEDSPPLNSSITGRIKNVKKRVSKCIEKALSNSISQPDLTKQESQSPMKTLNNAISKIVGLKKELANFNKSVVDSDYNYKRFPDKSCPRLSKSFCSADCTKEDLKDVLEEAKNLSLAFQNMSITSSKRIVSLDYKPINNLSAEDDLMSVKPPWEENGDCSLSSESDDSSIGLPKVKLFYLKKRERKRSEISAEEIEKYKKRIRASLDGNVSCDEESTTSKEVEDVKPDEISNIQLSESLMLEKKCLKEADQHECSGSNSQNSLPGPSSAVPTPSKKSRKLEDFLAGKIQLAANDLPDDILQIVSSDEEGESSDDDMVSPTFDSETEEEEELAEVPAQPADCDSDTEAPIQPASLPSLPAQARPDSTDFVWKNVLRVNIPTLPEVNDLRPKKRGNILKKGPLKAIVPLQKMTKTIADKISPLRKNSASSHNSVKSKQDGSFSSSIIYPVASSTPNGKDSSSKKTVIGTPLGSKPRLSRRDNEAGSKAKVNSFRRSVSLVSESRTSNPKVPFSSVNPNVKQSKGIYLNRPHTAPSKSNSTFEKSSPKSKELIHRRHQMAVNDKENRLQAF